MISTEILGTALLLDNLLFSFTPVQTQAVGMSQAESGSLFVQNFTQDVSPGGLSITHTLKVPKCI